MRRSCSSDSLPKCSPWNNPRICPQLPAFAAAAFAPDPVYSAKYRTREEVRPRGGCFGENNLSETPVNLSDFIQFYRILRKFVVEDAFARGNLLSSRAGALARRIEGGASKPEKRPSIRRASAATQGEGRLFRGMPPRRGLLKKSCPTLEIVRRRDRPPCLS